MRVGQNGGPLPSEAIIDLGAPIINNVQEIGTKLTATVRDASALKSQHESVHFRNRRTLRAFFATKRRLRRKTCCKKRPKLGYVSGDEEKDATVERCRKGLRLGRAVRNANKGKPDRVLHLRVASLSEGVRLDKGIRHHPIRVLRLRAASLSEGVQLDKRIRRVEPEVPGREGARTQDEWKDGTAWGTDPTPTDFGIEYTGRAQMVATWNEPVTTDL